MKQINDIFCAEIIESKGVIGLEKERKKRPADSIKSQFLFSPPLLLLQPAVAVRGTA